jgi:hypothetical protein
MQTSLHQQGLALDDLWGSDEGLRLIQANPSSKLALERLSSQMIQRNLQDYKAPMMPREEHIKERKFLYRESLSSPNQYVVYIMAGDRILEVRIDKSQFQKIYFSCQGNPERMRIAVYEHERNAYLIEANQKGVDSSPLRLLHQFCQRMDHHQLPELAVIYEGEPAVDAGGPGRQWIAAVVANGCQVLPMERRENGLLRPRLNEREDGSFQPLSETEEQAFVDLGKLMMFCLNAKTPYPIGQLFDGGIFAALKEIPFLSMDFDDIDFNVPSTFDRMFSIYEQMNSIAEDDVKMIQQIKKALYLDSKSSNADWLDAYYLVMNDPSIEQLNLGDSPTPEKLKEHGAAIQAAVRRYVIQNKLKPSLEPLHLMAKGMQQAKFQTVRFQDLQRIPTTEIALHLQGTVSKEAVLAQLEFNSSVGEQTRGWIREWIMHADQTKLEQFLFALSGSTGLSPTQKIKIAQQPKLEFRTCFNGVDLPNLDNKRDLFSMLDNMVLYIWNNKGFDKK